MNKECKDVILKHFVNLMANCNVHILKNHLINKGIFKEKEWGDIFEADDARHNKRMFFFNLFKKNNAWVPFLDALEETNQANIVHLLCRKGPTVFNPILNPSNSEPPELEPVFSNLGISVNNTTSPLKVRVIHSKKLFDTEEKNRKINFYSSRSKKRGRVLIINNYEFKNEEHPYRNGALVDDKNLRDLFQQMGGWDLDRHYNKTALEMLELIKKFAGEGKPDYDICSVIIMSHGGEMNNDTYIFGVDKEKMYELSVTKITKFFTNERSKSWRGKPKILLFPICRGPDCQLPINHEYRTETDSLFKNVPINTPTVMNLMRAEEDMLVGFSTAMGYKAHRDPYLGSWYIELLCQEFMNHAHEYSVTEILQLVDQGLRKRLTERHFMQTAEFRNLGFKNLYLNPGLYMENDVVKHFHSEL